jgi:hypothetical protein
MLALVLWMVPARAGYLVGNASNSGVFPAAQSTFSVEYLDPGHNGLGNWSVGGDWAFNALTSPCPPAFLVPPGSSLVCVGPESYAYTDSIGGAGECLQGNNPDSQPYPCEAAITFTGVLTLPDFDGAPPFQFTETIPVTFTGGGGSIDFSGWGDATVTLNEASDSYLFSSATYVLDPAPEPEAISLMGLGAILLLGLAKAHPYRQRSAPAARK